MLQGLCSQCVELNVAFVFLEYVVRGQGFGIGAMVMGAKTQLYAAASFIVKKFVATCDTRRNCIKITNGSGGIIAIYSGH